MTGLAGLQFRGDLCSALFRYVVVFLETLVKIVAPEAVVLNVQTMKERLGVYVIIAQMKQDLYMGWSMQQKDKEISMETI